jgi:hypothetical protein
VSASAHPWVFIGSYHLSHPFHACNSCCFSQFVHIIQNVFTIIRISNYIENRISVSWLHILVTCNLTISAWPDVQPTIYEQHTVQNFFVGISIICLRAKFLILKYKEGILYITIAPSYFLIYTLRKWQEKRQQYNNVTSTDAVYVKYYCNTTK